MSITPSQNRPLSAFNQQDHFLAFLMEKKIPAFIFLKNGVRLKGFIREFDIHTVLFTTTLDEQTTSQHLIYKHVISTIAGDYLAAGPTITGKPAKK